MGNSSLKNSHMNFRWKTEVGKPKLESRSWKAETEVGINRNRKKLPKLKSKLVSCQLNWNVYRAKLDFFFEFNEMIFWKTKIEHYSFSKPSFVFQKICRLMFGWFGLEYWKGIVLSACIYVSLLPTTAVSRNCWFTVIWTFFFLNFVFP